MHAHMGHARVTVVSQPVTSVPAVLQLVGASRFLIQATLQDEVVRRNGGKLVVADGRRTSGLVWSEDGGDVLGEGRWVRWAGWTLGALGVLDALARYAAGRAGGRAGSWAGRQAGGQAGERADA